MAVEVLVKMRFTCDDCGKYRVEERRDGNGTIPEGWDNRYDPAKHTRWDPYLKMDIVEDGYTTLLCCDACKNKHMKWEAYREYVRGHDGR